MTRLDADTDAGVDTGRAPSVGEPEISSGAGFDFFTPATGAPTIMRKRRSGRRQVFAVILILLIGAGYFGVVDVESVRTTAILGDHANVVTGAGNLAQANCLRTAVRRKIPQGAQVYIEPNQQNALLTAMADLYVTLWADPTPEPTTAKYDVFMIAGPHGCAGVQLEVGLQEGSSR